MRVLKACIAIRPEKPQASSLSQTALPQLIMGKAAAVQTTQQKTPGGEAGRLELL
jgi:hypothetical protein